MSDLEQFCLLAKTQKGLACSALVQQVLGHKRIYTFGELLNTNSVQALRGSEFDKCFNTLELFAFGTFDDYLEKSSSYLTLTSPQIAKLKILTLLSVAGTSKSLSYGALLNRLHLSSVRELEDIIIEAIYAGLVSGKLDQAKQVFHIAHSQSRDVKLSNVDDFIQKLSDWKAKCDYLNNTLHRSNSIIEKCKTAHEQEQEQTQSLTDLTKKRIKDTYESGADMSELGSWRSEPPKSGRSLMKRSMIFKQ